MINNYNQKILYLRSTLVPIHIKNLSGPGKKN